MAEWISAPALIKNAGNRAVTINLYTRFLAKVETHGFDPDLCWEWMGATKGEPGYGHLTIMINGAKASASAHRRSYELFIGPVPTKLSVLHVNPDHLLVGTHKENAEDAKMKGRLSCSEIHSRIVLASRRKTKLRKFQVRRIVELLDKGISRELIAKQYDVDISNIGCIDRGEIWNHVSNRRKQWQA